MKKTLWFFVLLLIINNCTANNNDTIEYYKHKIGISISHFYNYPIIKVNQATIKYNTPKYGYSFAFNYNKKISDKLSINTGLSVYRINSSFLVSRLPNYESGFAFAFREDSFTSFAIPFSFDYIILNKNINLFCRFGLSVHNGIYISELKNLWNIPIFGASAGFGIQKSINNRIDINIVPFYKIIGIRDFFFNNSNYLALKTMEGLAGISFGINYKF